MFEMYKYILAKVSFDKNIFKKELTKAATRLKEEEIIELRKWCAENFNKQYQGLFEEVFSEKYRIPVILHSGNTIAA